MKARHYIGGAIILVFLGLLFYNFTRTNIEYESDFTKVMQSGKVCKATGVWVKEKSFQENIQDRTFIFYLRDAKNNEMKVVYKGTKPNNFEIATNVVVTGKYENGYFQATDVLTKCPSKYEGQNINTSGS
ncbi:MAG: cytochrome c maturation protein CcmE [Ignavibacteria bacterium]|jgi:cytochrome c-type biogenesis protein CcmE|nr:cytochrome c maturation protein CcmE [Ignavibacteria bacterium]MDH7527850.1 cytochrome c maturation protein CcmE [Ignavibacteria bacterium]NPV11900.1 cytochrome c maturation protein CcmE [Ignavibacteria bacterium]